MKTLTMVALLALAGCTHQIRLAIPQTQVKTQTVYIAVPAELTTPFDVPEPATNTAPDAVAAFNARGDTIRLCNGRFKKIRDLGMQP